ncbi:6-bladed beta-propeller [Litoribacter populi]|uniref:6-bladed beta-propeller n=1 Tax=Litoribacter populi TaxID=2598460 RepID=UPI00117D6EEA|nr:6-bladed beta-propeller [Litoribacter populi]
MMIKLRFLLILFIFTLSCSDKNGEQLGYTLINVHNLKDDGNKLIEMVSEYELIPLQYAGAESLVSMIIKTEITSQNIYLLCSRSNGSKYLLIFDIEGDFRRKIEEISSDELISSKVKYFALDNDGQLIILDDKNNLLFLDENYDYHMHTSLPFKFDTFYKNGEHFLSYANLHAFDLQPDSLFFNLMVVNEHFELENKYMPFEINVGETRYHNRIHGNIQPNLNGFLFTEFLNDTIYEVDEQSMMPKYVYNFGKDRVDKEGFENVHISPFSPILVEKFKWGLNSPIETEKYLFAHYWDKKTPKGILYNKTNNTTAVHNPMNLLEDQDIIPWPKIHRDGYFYGYFTEGDFGGMDIDRIINYPKTSSVKQIYEHIQANANPVFVKYKINN